MKNWLVQLIRMGKSIRQMWVKLVLDMEDKDQPVIPSLTTSCFEIIRPYPENTNF